MASPNRVHFDHGREQIALGLVPGYSIFEKHGRHPGISTGSAEDVWNGTGLYTGQPTGAAETLEISSSSDLDTVTSGSGAWTVEISNLLDGDKAKMPNIVVALDGNPAGAGSWVSLGAALYTRGTRIRVLTGGSGGSNAGVITLRHTTTTTNIFGVVPIGANRTALAAYTVPEGYTLLMDGLLMQMTRTLGGAGSAQMSFRARKEGNVFETVVPPEISDHQDYVLQGSYIFTQKTDIKARCEDASANGTILIAEMSGILVDNEVLVDSTLDNV